MSFVICERVTSQDITVMLAEAKRLEAVPDEKGAFIQLTKILKVDPSNLQVLSKCSELCSRIGKREKTDKSRDDYYAAAVNYASTAIKINPAYSEANCVMAIALGRTALTKSGKEKIINAKEIKRYVDIALKNDPLNYKAWHVLGRCNYEISNLNVFERTAVKLLYGGLPEASINASINSFEKARTIAPAFILNYFELAKAYKKSGQKDKAIETIRTMLSLPNQTEDDVSIKTEGNQLLGDLL